MYKGLGYVRKGSKEQVLYFFAFLTPLSNLGNKHRIDIFDPILAKPFNPNKITSCCSFSKIMLELLLNRK